MSVREEIQNRLADKCRELDLNEVYGVLTGKFKRDDGRVTRTVTFCKARTLDGCIEIFGPKFITVSSNRTGRDVFHSVEEVEKFLEETF